MYLSRVNFQLVWVLTGIVVTSCLIGTVRINFHDSVNYWRRLTEDTVNNYITNFVRIASFNNWHISNFESIMKRKTQEDFFCYLEPCIRASAEAPPIVETFSIARKLLARCSVIIFSVIHRSTHNSDERQIGV